MSEPPWIDEDFCYVTTTGRRSGEPHRIEIWFGYRAGTFYLMSGGGMSSDWVANIAANPDVTVEVGAETFTARGRFVDGGEEETWARRELAARYQDWRDGQPLSEWARTALVVALDLSDVTPG